MSSVAILAFNEIYRVRIWKSRVQLNAVFILPQRTLTLSVSVLIWCLYSWGVNTLVWYTVAYSGSKILLSYV